MRASLLLVTLLLTMSHPALCQQQTPEVGIRETLQKYLDAFNAGDADAVAAIYTPNGSHTYALGFTHHGRTEIAQGIKELLAGPLKGAKMSAEILRITPLTPTIAIEESRFALDGLKSPDGRSLPQVRGLCLATYQYLDQHWLAAAVQCLVPPPQEQR